MYIRFYSGEIHARSQVTAGLFKAATDLWCSDDTPDYELEALADLRLWFDEYLPSPFDYLPRGKSFERGVCWFKATAHEHFARAWELVELLERNDILIWTIKSPRVGYVHYEDRVQVLARPYDDIRILLKGNRK
jgi:hypothetical protein